MLGGFPDAMGSQNVQAIGKFNPLKNRSASMTATAPETASRNHLSTDNPGSPMILGLSHLGLTVRDLPAAQQFWTSVMGFATLIEGKELCMFADRTAGLAIGITNQQGKVEGTFDERRIGLDHLALAVADVAALEQWESRLTEYGVPHDVITTSDAGYHLNLRAPDDFPIELFVLTDEGAANLGLSPGDGNGAGTHRLDS
jgi:glyoxylase I family protein